MGSKITRSEREGRTPYLWPFRNICMGCDKPIKHYTYFTGEEYCYKCYHEIRALQEMYKHEVPKVSKKRRD